MNTLKKFFRNSHLFFCSERGGMLVELLLTVALTAILIPFVFQYQQKAIERSKNIVITREMENIKDALERYISENRSALMSTKGKNITRVELASLSDFGVPASIIDRDKDKYQIRILKSSEKDGKSALQGIIIMSSKDITPLRTREIVELGGVNTGFIEGNKAYGNFGSWRFDTVNIGSNLKEGIIKSTGINGSDASYLWRIPSGNAQDATMMSALNLGGHNIDNCTFFNAVGMKLDEMLNVGEIAAKKVIFQNRTTINDSFIADNGLVSGGLTSDSKSMRITKNLNLEEIGKFTSFTAKDLWTHDLKLNGLSISGNKTNSTLRVNDAIDMTLGHISALHVTVGFDGSVTPRLVVRERITDSLSPNYFWDATDNTANFMDLSLTELNRMASIIVTSEKKGNTDAEKIFRSVAINKNATVTEFIKALGKIESEVSEKYRLLNSQ